MSMKKIDFAKEYFEEANIKTKLKLLVVDEVEIEALNLLLCEGKTLPEDIIKIKKDGYKQLSDMQLKSAILENNDNIVKRERTVKDEDLISELSNHFVKTSTVLEGFQRKTVYVNGYLKEKFFYTDSFDYFLAKYDFYRIIHLCEDEIEFVMRAKNVASLNSISKTLYFFKIIMIISLALALIGMIVGLSAL